MEEINLDSASLKQEVLDEIKTISLINNDNIANTTDEI
jgi:hypothetical protein